MSRGQAGSDRTLSRGQAVNRESRRRHRPRVALVHDWLTGMRGGEKVLEAICELYPDAPLFTLVHVRGSVSPAIERHRVRTSFVQRLPPAVRRYRQFLPLFPAAVELFDLDGFDLVISTQPLRGQVGRPAGPGASTSATATRRCATPGISSRPTSARRRSGRTRSQLLPAGHGAGSPGGTRPRPAGSTAIVANSQYVAERIRRYYNRESTVVYPPVDTAFYRPDDDRRPSPLGLPGRVGAGAVQAARRRHRRLSPAGGAPDDRRHGSRAEAGSQAMAGPDVTFLGLAIERGHPRALPRGPRPSLLPGVEDFGIVPVEAQACGCPVVALGRGGAAETVIDGVTGVLVPDAAARSVRRRAQPRASPCVRSAGASAHHAVQFSRDRFLESFQAAVDAAVEARRDGERRRRLPVAPARLADDAALQPAARGVLRRHATRCSGWRRSSSPTCSASRPGSPTSCPVTKG